MFALFQRTVTLFLEILIFRFFTSFYIRNWQKNKEHPKLKNNLVMVFVQGVPKKKLTIFGDILRPKKKYLHAQYFCIVYSTLSNNCLIFVFFFRSFSRFFDVIKIDSYYFEHCITM